MTIDIDHRSSIPDIGQRLQSWNFQPVEPETHGHLPMMRVWINRNIGGVLVMTECRTPDKEIIPGSLTFYAQWSLGKAKVSLADETETSKVLNSLRAHFGFFDPNYPQIPPVGLELTTLYPSNFVTDKMRARRIASIRANGFYGLRTMMNGLHALNGRFVSPWQSGSMAYDHAREMLLNDDERRTPNTFEARNRRRFEAMPDWFQALTGRALTAPADAATELAAQKIVPFSSAFKKVAGL